MITINPGVGPRLAAQEVARRRQVLWSVAVIVTFAIAIVVTGSIGVFPESWNLGLADPVNDIRGWLISNQTDHWLFTFVLDPISDSVEYLLVRFEDFLTWLPFPTHIAVTAFALWRTRGWIAGVAGGIGIAYAGAVDLWEPFLQTFAIMAASVVIALLIGIPVGLWASNHDRFRAVLRSVLDVMQTLPAFVYLIPFVLLFGIGRVPSVLATVIFALPPVIRLTDIGIRGIPGESVEAAQMFGATPRQTLGGVQIPLARPAILAGVNQTILLAMSMVVIAGFIGAGGLGQIVLRSLRDLDVGRATEAGIAIVVMAILLDRFTQGLSTEPGAPRKLLDRPIVVSIVGAGVVLTIVGRAFDWVDAPGWLEFSYAGRVNDFVDWTQTNLFEISGTGLGTGPFSDFVTIWLVTPLREFLSSDLAWPVVIGLVTIAGWQLGRARLAAIGFGGLFAIGLLGMWELSMDTLAQVLVALGMCLVIGIPLGILAARKPLVEALLRPVLDFLQTIPSFVLLVPVIILFNVGRVPGIIASVLYAVPVTIRLTTLGLKGVDERVLEASTMFGATPRQTLRKVELPLAGGVLVAAVNQTIMLVLSMVVIAGLVGGGGLGLETVRGLRRSDAVGSGFEAGIAIVLLAMVLDRFTQTMADRLQPPTNPN